MLALFSIPIFFYLVTILTALHSWVVRPYFREPKPRSLRDIYLFEPPEFTKQMIIAQFISDYEWNTTVLKRKLR